MKRVSQPGGVMLQSGQLLYDSPNTSAYAPKVRMVDENSIPENVSVTAGEE